MVFCLIRADPSLFNLCIVLVFFFQAEDGIRDSSVTGVQTCALPISLAETSGATVHLVERNAKKAAFLREALRVTNSPGTVHLTDIGDSVDRITGLVDCVTARAVAPLHQLIGFAEPLAKQGAKPPFPNGQDSDAELTEAPT